jgi:RHS repeat-associated protein
VLTTFSDRKIAYEGTAGYVAYYTSEILSSTDYYPFGFQMPGRVFEGDGYRYGFNSMEKDDEIKGSGNSYDFGARIYDPRVGKFLMVDFFESKFAYQATYLISGNDPIRFSDLGGNFKLDEATKKAYPELDAYLKTISQVYIDKPAEFKQAFKEYGQLTDSEVTEMLTYGKGPTINVAMLTGADAQTKYREKSDGKLEPLSITINISIVEEYKRQVNNKEGLAVDLVAAKLVLEANIFHEGTHWGDISNDGQLDKTQTVNGMQVTPCGGDKFEDAAYGEQIFLAMSKNYVRKNDHEGAATKDKMDKLEQEQKQKVSKGSGMDPSGAGGVGAAKTKKR